MDFEPYVPDNDQVKTRVFLLAFRRLPAYAWRYVSNVGRLASFDVSESSWVPNELVFASPEGGADSVLSAPE